MGIWKDLKDIAKVGKRIEDKIDAKREHKEKMATDEEYRKKIEESKKKDDEEFKKFKKVAIIDLIVLIPIAALLIFSVLQIVKQKEYVYFVVLLLGLIVPSAFVNKLIQRAKDADTIRCKTLMAIVVGLYILVDIAAIVLLIMGWGFLK